MYKWLNAERTALRRLADGASIPVDAGNTDYLAALDWVAAGNVIPPVDPPTPAQVTESQRVQALDAAILSDATINAMRAMDLAAFNTWWTANVTNLAQANNILKRLCMLVLRRL